MTDLDPKALAAAEAKFYRSKSYSDGTLRGAIHAYLSARGKQGFVEVRRSPTKPMCIAANRVSLDRGDLGEFAVTGYEAQDIWAAMIDAALADSTTGEGNG